MKKYRSWERERFFFFSRSLLRVSVSTKERSASSSLSLSIARRVLVIAAVVSSLALIFLHSSFTSSFTSSREFLVVAAARKEEFRARIFL